MKTTIQGDTQVTEGTDYEGLSPATVAAIESLKNDVADFVPMGMFAILRHSSGHVAVTMELNHVDLTVMNMDMDVAVANFRALWELYKTLPRCMGTDPVAHA